MRKLLPLLLAIGLISFWSFTSNPIKVVVIDAGHGGHDPGFHEQENSPLEKDLTLKLSKRLATLAVDYPQLKIYTTRNSDEFVDLKTRAKIAQVLQPQVFISLHLEGGPTAGSGLKLMTNAQSTFASESQVLAQQLLQKLSSNKMLGVQPQVQNFDSYLLKNAQCPALLLNLGNLSKAEEMAYWQQEENIDAFCHQVLSALSQ